MYYKLYVWDNSDVLHLWDEEILIEVYDPFERNHFGSRWTHYLLQTNLRPFSLKSLKIEGLCCSAESI